MAKYIIPKAQVKGDDKEIERLIKQLPKIDEWGNPLEYPNEKHIKVVKRLGEIGDPRAMEALMKRSSGLLSLELAEVIEEAIKKIKNANKR